MAPSKAVFIAGILTVTLTNTLVAQDAEKVPEIHSGACVIPYIAPAIIETITEQVLVSPEQRAIDPETGQDVVVQSAVYSTNTVQKIVQDRRQAWAKTVCAKDQTPVFLQSLQRALLARDYYRGPITGQMDDRTKRAIRKYQKTKEINSDQVTIDMAEKFGLITHRLFNK